MKKTLDFIGAIIRLSVGGLLIIFSFVSLAYVFLTSYGDIVELMGFIGFGIFFAIGVLIAYKGLVEILTMPRAPKPAPQPVAYPYIPQQSAPQAPVYQPAPQPAPQPVPQPVPQQPMYQPAPQPMQQPAPQQYTQDQQ